jgi:hypothetical protein
MAGMSGLGSARLGMTRPDMARLGRHEGGGPTAAARRHFFCEVDKSIFV